jgi:hypothetical protein
VTCYAAGAIERDYRVDEASLSISLLVITAGWVSVGLVIWAVTAPADQAWCRWPGLCEGCGYPLVGVDPSGECPECGRAVRASLPRVAADRAEAPGNPWETHPSMVGYLNTMGLALFAPRRLGQRLSPRAGGRSHLGFLILNTALAYPVSWLGFMSMFTFLAVWDGEWRSPDWIELAVFSLWVSSVAAGWVMGASVLIGGLVGGLLSPWIARLNPLTASTQAAAYLSAVSLVAVAGFWALVVMTSLVIAYLESLDSRISWDALGVLISVAWGAAALCVSLVYVIGFWRMMLGLRHRNV